MLKDKHLRKYTLLSLAVAWLLAMALMAYWYHHAQQKQQALLDYYATLPAPKAEIIIYGTSWCGYCKRLKKKFDTYHVPYKDIDIEKDPLAEQFFVQQGYQGVPVVYVGDQVIEGDDLSLINAAFAQIGYPVILH